MQTYRGSCHCKRVRFEIATNLKIAVACNCSICTKKGALHHRVAPEQFKLLSGADALSLYQFDSKIAKHWFCKHCGIHPFSNPRAAPEMYSVNVRCLDDFDLEAAELEIRQFDGRNWEEAIKTLKLD
ncbi:MAG: GFA family protein [Candidatus Competibacter sp.]